MNDRLLDVIYRVKIEEFKDSLHKWIIPVPGNMIVPFFCFDDHPTLYKYIKLLHLQPINKSNNTIQSIQKVLTLKNVTMIFYIST